MSPIVSEPYEFVIGVDTHAATHTLAVLAAGSGAVLDSDTFPTTAAGLARVPEACRLITGTSNNDRPG